MSSLSICSTLAVNAAGNVPSFATAVLLNSALPAEESACVGELVDGDLVSWVVSLLTSFKVDGKEAWLFRFGDDMIIIILDCERSEQM